jgi:hypothetical protein
MGTLEPVELIEWIVAEHDSVLGRFENSVVSVVPLERWRDPAGPGGSSLAWLAFHTAYHEDVAVNAVLRSAPIRLADVRDDLGIVAIAPAVGLGEAEAHELSAALDLEALLAYVRAVHGGTAGWLAGVEPSALTAVPASADALASAGIDDTEVPWLYRMWDGKPASFFVQWEAIGHRINHVGEMVSLRNRLGLSPF